MLCIGSGVVVAQWSGCRTLVRAIGVRFSDTARHGMQIGQNAFETSLPLPTQERAWRDWVVGLCYACACVFEGGRLSRRLSCCGPYVAVYFAHVCT